MAVKVPQPAYVFGSAAMGAFIPGDIHIVDQPSDTKIGNHPYPWAWNITFHFYLHCVAGKRKGQDISSDHRTFRIDGRDITEVK